MKKSFLFNLIILFALNIFVKPIWLFLDMQVQVNVGEKYGLFAALLNLSAILNIVLDLGLSNYNNRKVSINPKRFSIYFQNIATIRVVLAVVYLLILQLIGTVLGYSGDSLRLLFLLGGAQVFLASLLYIRSNFTAFGKFKLDSVFSVLDRVLMIGGVLYLLSNKGEGLVNIENFIYVQFYGYGASFIIGLFTLLVIGKPQLPKLNRRFSKVLLRKSAPYALIVILMAAYHYSDSIMIERMLPDGEAQNAIYAQSFRILMALNNYAYLFAVLLLPMFSKLLAKQKVIVGLIGTSSSLLIFGVSAISILFCYYSEDVIGLCYGDFDGASRYFNGRLNTEAIINLVEINESARVFQLLIVGIIPMSINYCFGTLITASGNMKVLNRLALTSLVLNVLLNLALIPKQGAYGAALASLITQSFSGVGQVIFAIKLFRLPINFLRLLRFISGVALIGVSVMFLNDVELYMRLVVLLVILLIGFILSVNLKGVLKMAKGFGGNEG